MDQNDNGDRDRDNQATKQPNNPDDHQSQRRINHFSFLGTIESESESSDEESQSNNFDIDDYEFFESSAFDSELRLLGDGDDDDDYEEMDEDDDDDDEDDDGLDVDELTYEELIALGEFIGVEERGLSRDEISVCLRPIESKSTAVIESRCVICQMEYDLKEGENLVALHCEHAYHTECIAQWLQIKKSCPICASEVSSSSSSSSSSSTAKNSNKDSS